MSSESECFSLQREANACSSGGDLTKGFHLNLLSLRHLLLGQRFSTATTHLTIGSATIDFLTGAIGNFGPQFDASVVGDAMAMDSENNILVTYDHSGIRYITSSSSIFCLISCIQLVCLQVMFTTIYTFLVAPLSIFLI